MTALLAIVALVVLFPLFGLFLRGGERAGESGCSGEVLGQCGTCGAKAEATDCPLARRGPKAGGE